MNQPMATMTRNPMILGTAASSRERAWAIEVVIASPQSRIGTGTMADPFEHG
jgi:hypothetical protein